MNIKSKTIFCVLVAIFLFSGFGYAKSKIYMNLWQTAPISINGEPSDWQTIKAGQMEKWGIDYRFSNNNQYIYGILILNNMKFLSSIYQTGLTVWINQGKNKKKSLGINFLKGKINADTFIQLMEKQRGPMSPEQKMKIKQRPFYTINQYKILRKDSKEIFNIDTKAAVSALFHINYSKKQAVIEFRIPMQTTPDDPVCIGANPGEQITLGFAWGGLTDQMKKEMMLRRAESGSRTNAGQPIGLKQERRVSSGYDKPFKRPKKYNFWVPIKLATQK